MKVALYTTNRTAVPPPADVVAASAVLTGQLADGLVARGHDVTLYAPQGSRTDAAVVDLGLPPSNLDFALSHDEWDLKDSLGMKQLYIGELFKRADEYDIIHVQTEPVYLGMPFTRLVETPTVFTNHNPYRVEQRDIFTHYRKLPLTTISNSQRRVLPDLNYVATVYNGIPAEEYTVADDPTGDYLYFCGRLVAAKGVSEAIAASEATGKNLRISGVGRQDFINEVIQPHVSAAITFLGPVTKDSTRFRELYADAYATLVPIQWEEPFGMVMIESMACGTPVIGFARGAVPEVVEDGVTGYVVNASDDDIRGDFVVKKTGMEGLMDAINRLYDLPLQEYREMRRAARKRVEEQFSLDAMVAGYERVYQAVVAA